MVKKYKRKSLTYSYIMNENNKDMEHVIGVICRQTTYDREKCIEKLEEFEGDFVKVKNGSWTNDFHIAQLRDIWFETSYLLDKKQSGEAQATLRFDNYKNQPLNFKFSQDFSGSRPNYTGKRPIAAVLREKGSNSEREMANALYLAGFDVKDVHMTDLISGREDLTEVQMIAAVGGFSNSDVLGSAKGWAGAFLYNEKAN